MSKHELVCRMKPYIQPFERVLALRELESLSGTAPTVILEEMAKENTPVLYSVSTEGSASYLADRLTYWEAVFAPGKPSRQLLTRQVRCEATTNLVRNGNGWEQLGQILPFREQVPLPNHRNLRYGPHGIHEYRGKFFPQLVRSLLNVASIDTKSIVLDPMCGSGTAPVEAVLLGCKAFGVDLNPLSVLMSRAKCGILSTSPQTLRSEYEALKRDLMAMPKVKSDDSKPWLEHLPAQDKEYLVRWFSGEALAGLDRIAKRVSETPHIACRLFFTVSLSNIIRRVSWQKDDDLRVRKEVRSDDADVLSEFMTELSKATRTVLAFLLEDKGFKLGHARILEGDARRAGTALQSISGKVDAIVTSPPYATALPYLDTDRLSLSYLGLLSRRDHRRRDFDMIGNREITNRQRQDLWEVYCKSKPTLPKDITSLIDQIAFLNKTKAVGFRRQNLPALLARYFLDMRLVFSQFRTLLHSGAPVYMVVGNNHTIAGNRRVEIETDTLLAQLGESVGLELEGTISMEMLVSRDIFRRNAGSAETIIQFRNP